MTCLFNLIVQGRWWPKIRKTILEKVKCITYGLRSLWLLQFCLQLGFDWRLRRLSGGRATRGLGLVGPRNSRLHLSGGHSCLGAFDLVLEVLCLLDGDANLISVWRVNLLLLGGAIQADGKVHAVDIVGGVNVGWKLLFAGVVALSPHVSGRLLLRYWFVLVLR